MICYITEVYTADTADDELFVYGKVCARCRRTQGHATCPSPGGTTTTTSDAVSPSPSAVVTATQTSSTPSTSAKAFVPFKVRHTLALSGRLTYLMYPTASELILEWRGPKGRERGMRFLGRDSQPLPTNQGFYGSAVSSLSGVRGRRVFLYSEPSDCLYQHLSTCCIQFAWLGIRFF